jgi:hypothetical protein
VVEVFEELFEELFTSFELFFKQGGVLRCGGAF